MLLKKYIQELLLIESGDISSIYNIINRLRSQRKVKLVINDDGDSLTVCYSSDDIGMQKKSDPIVGFLVCESVQRKFTGDIDADGVSSIGPGESNPVWEIVEVSRVTKGMGPLLYEVAIEWISNIKNCALKSDSVGVTLEAKKIWDIFDKREDITKIQLDICDEEAAKFNVEQLTATKEDDTYQATAVLNKMIKSYNDEEDDDYDSDWVVDKEWYKSSLSRAYRKDSTEIIDFLGDLCVINR